MNTQVATIDHQDVAVQGKPSSFGEQLKSKAGQFNAALPAHIPVERFMRVIMTAIQNNPGLQSADRQTLWNSAMRAAQDGLLPDGREGALVIYKSKAKDDRGKDLIDSRGRQVWEDRVQWMPMIAGVRKKVRNSGEISTWDAQVVHAKDQFEFELGDDPFIKHKPYLPPMLERRAGEPDDEFDERWKSHAHPGPVIAAYSVAVLKSGEKSREVMTRAQLDKVRGSSKAKDRGPWVDWFEEMCRKTVARRHSKVLPMSTDLDDLIRRDDDLYDMRGARQEANAVGGGKPLSLAAKLDALSQIDIPETDHDPETGEVIHPKDIHADTTGDSTDTQNTAADAPPAAAASAGSAEPGAKGEAADTRPAASSGDTTRKAELAAQLELAATHGTRRLTLAFGKLSEAEDRLFSEKERAGLHKTAKTAEKAEGG